MSAADHIHPGQLAMFMPAEKIAAGRLHDSAPGPDAKKRMLNYKRNENSEAWAGKDLKLTTRNDAFAQGGIKTPLEMGHYTSEDTGDTEVMLDNGHHRLAWALDKDPKMELPVKHDFYRRY